MLTDDDGPLAPVGREPLLLPPALLPLFCALGVDIAVAACLLAGVGACINE